MGKFHPTLGSQLAIRISQTVECVMGEKCDNAHFTGTAACHRNSPGRYDPVFPKETCFAIYVNIGKILDVISTVILK